MLPINKKNITYYDFVIYLILLFLMITKKRSSNFLFLINKEGHEIFENPRGECRLKKSWKTLIYTI